MATIPLYQLTADYAALADELVANNGEATPEIEAQLAALEGAIEDKVERIALVIRNMKAAVEAQQKEADRLQSDATCGLNAINRLKSYAMQQLELAGIAKVKTPLVSAWIQNSPPSAKWTGDPENPPSPYRREKLIVSFNAKQALEDYKNGGALPDGVVVEQGKNLQLR